MAAALEATGGTTDDLAKLTYYVVNWEPSMFEDLAAGVRAAREKQQLADVASTLIGATSLFAPEMLVEIDAVAVLDA